MKTLFDCAITQTRVLVSVDLFDRTKSVKERGSESSSILCSNQRRVGFEWSSHGGEGG